MYSKIILLKLYVSFMNKLGFIYAILAATTWGLVYVLNQKVLNNTTPLILIFLGSLITALITLPILAFQWHSISDY